MASRSAPSFFRDLIHVAGLVLLLLVLLVVVTRFKVVHPSVIPGWQGVYCTYISESLGQKHSTVGFIYGKDGLGDPEKLVDDLSKFRPTMRTELIRLDDVSAGALSRYEVVVLEKTHSVPFKTITALEKYLDNGGSLVWTGDALSNQTLDRRDLEEARQKNATLPHFANNSGTGKDYYSWFVENSQDQHGFGDFGDRFVGAYLKNQRAGSGVTLKPIVQGHLLLAGIKETDLPPALTYSVVNQNPEADVLANIDNGQETVPGILEMKYVGRIVYIAFPLESLNSTSFIDNVFDYLVTC